MYEVHPLAGIVPLASDKEQVALTEDIKMNGQIDPAILWQGKIVDGRCRQLACLSLGIELLVESLDDNLSYEEVRRIVKSVNTRRNLTNTQKVISAHKEYVAGYGTLSEISTAWAIARMSLANANYIAKHRPEFIAPLFNGDSITIMNSKGEEVITNKVNTIAKIIKDVKDLNIVIDDTYETGVKYSVEELPLSSPMYEWYGDKLSEYKSFTPEGKEMMLKALLFELAKYKEIGRDKE